MAKAVQPVGKHFPAVKKAREALKERALELLDGYIAIIKQSAAAGDFETAAKGYQFLIEHMPAEDGERLVDISVDKPKPGDDKAAGPRIQIGLNIGGVGSQPSLPAPAVEVVDITPEDDKS